MEPDDFFVVDGARPAGDSLIFRDVVLPEYHYFIFMKVGDDPGVMGQEEIAKINLRDGTVTYSAPDAGRDAARVFWGMFEDYIKEQIALHKKELDGA